MIPPFLLSSAMYSLVYLSSCSSNNNGHPLRLCSSCPVGAANRSSSSLSLNFRPCEFLLYCLIVLVTPFSVPLWAIIAYYSKVNQPCVPCSRVARSLFINGLTSSLVEMMEHEDILDESGPSWSGKGELLWVWESTKSSLLFLKYLNRDIL